MSKQINLYWYKEEEGSGNFGDELNHYIVKALSDKEIAYADIMKWPKTKQIAFKILAKRVIQGKWAGLKNTEAYKMLLNQEVLVAIGSVIAWFDGPGISVWGAGLMNQKGHINNAKFYAVRGEYTLNKIKDLGYDTTTTVLGDPALLLPLIFNPQTNKKDKIGIIPHFTHYEKVKNHYCDSPYLVINLLDDIEKVVEEINSCAMTFSSSLHGVIVSHAYQIPSLWIDFEKTEVEKIAGDNIKFKDYFSSVQLEEYHAINIDALLENLEQTKEKYKTILLPHKSVVPRLQQGLMSNAPFSLKEKYKNYLDNV